MDWDQYKEASNHLFEEFIKKIRNLEIEILMGNADPVLKESMREDIRNLLSEQFALQDQLDSIKRNPDMIAQVVADIIGLKGAVRDQWLLDARNFRANNTRNN